MKAQNKRASRETLAVDLRAASDVAVYASVLAHAVETFGSRTKANAWLNRPTRVFGNRSPIQVITQYPRAVEEELVRIDHGMFV